MVFNCTYLNHVEKATDLSAAEPGVFLREKQRSTELLLTCSLCVSCPKIKTELHLIIPHIMFRFEFYLLTRTL